MSRFPPSGPTGCRSPSSAVLSRHYDFLPPVPPHFVAFARRYHPCTLASLPPAWSATPRAGGFRDSAPVTPVRILGWRRQGLPGSWGTRMRACPALRPRRDRKRQAIAASRCGLPPPKRRRLPPTGYFRGSITRPTNSLSTLRRVDHSTATQDSLPAAGQTLPGGIGYPLGSNERFQPLHRFLLSQASPGAMRS